MCGICSQKLDHTSPQSIEREDRKSGFKPGLRSCRVTDHFQTLEKPGSSFSWQSASLCTPVLACTRPVHPPTNAPRSDHISSRWSLREASMFSRLIGPLPGGSTPPCRL
ncbi:hypothetical protein ATANTOWER_032491 [Ataeniobius toweri]|uniref:Uncharacterized protein n=1 Tax=Ataeniobius toweri TaxID=208326 RepID=A0ABU7A4I5_9TELE|nr:hypothetical protein [Ataeniobius toweri]